MRSYYRGTTSMALCSNAIKRPASRHWRPYHGLSGWLGSTLFVMVGTTLITLLCAFA